MAVQTGLLRERIAFDKRLVAVDGYGNERTDFAHAFTVWGRKHMLVGGETVLAARLTGVSPAVITVRSTSWTREVTTDWRCRDVRTGEVFNVRAVTPTEDHADIDILVDKGVHL